MLVFLLYIICICIHQIKFQIESYILNEIPVIGNVLKTGSLELGDMVFLREEGYISSSRHVFSTLWSAEKSRILEWFRKSNPGHLHAETRQIPCTCLSVLRFSSCFSLGFICPSIHPLSKEIIWSINVDFDQCSWLLAVYFYNFFYLKLIFKNIILI
jgi:hypothetical protein